MADRVDQQFGNYQLIRLLGEGGFAEVYLGEHIHLGTQAAIKVLHTQLTSSDLDKFRNEARTIARLIHPHIVRVLEFGVEDTTPFLVMDYAPHGTLRQCHPKGTCLPFNTIVSYVNQIANALQYAHEEKVIHRDIKPENMLIGRRDDILLSDFGIAMEAKSSLYQSVQEMAGTIAYMAPEQIQGKPRPASDQYSLGIVVYEWLCGDRPFHGLLNELVGQQLYALPPSLHEKAPTIPYDVEQVVMKALTKDPHQRYVNVQAFAAALQEACLRTSFHQASLSIAVPPSNELSLSSNEIVVISQSQPSIPLNVDTPPGQLSPAALPITPFPASTIPPPSVNQAYTPEQPHPARHHISNQIIVVSLLGLAAIASGLTLVVFLWAQLSEIFFYTVVLCELLFIAILGYVTITLRAFIAWRKEKLSEKVKGQRADKIPKQNIYERRKEAILHHQRTIDKLIKDTRQGLSSVRRIRQLNIGSFIREHSITIAWLVSFIGTLCLVMFVLPDPLSQLIDAFVPPGVISDLLRSLVVIILGLFIPVFFPLAITLWVARLLHISQGQGKWYALEWQNEGKSKRGDTESVSISVTKQLTDQQILEEELGKRLQEEQKGITAFYHYDLPDLTQLPTSDPLNYQSVFGWAVQELRSKAPQRYEEIREFLPDIKLSDEVVDSIIRNYADEKNLIFLYILLRQAAYIVKQRRSTTQIIIPANQYAQEVLRELGYDPDYVEQITIAIELGR